MNDVCKKIVEHIVVSSAEECEPKFSVELDDGISVWVSSYFYKKILFCKLQYDGELYTEYVRFCCLERLIKVFLARMAEPKSRELAGEIAKKVNVITICNSCASL